MAGEAVFAIGFGAWQGVTAQVRGVLAGGRGDRTEIEALAGTVTFATGQNDAVNGNACDPVLSIADAVTVVGTGTIGSIRCGDLTGHVDIADARAVNMTATEGTIVTVAIVTGIGVGAVEVGTVPGAGGLVGSVETAAGIERFCAVVTIGTIQSNRAGPVAPINHHVAAVGTGVIAGIINHLARIETDTGIDMIC